MESEGGQFCECTDIGDQTGQLVETEVQHCQLAENAQIRDWSGQLVAGKGQGSQVGEATHIRYRTRQLVETEVQHCQLAEGAQFRERSFQPNVFKNQLRNAPIPVSDYAVPGAERRVGQPVFAV